MKTKSNYFSVVLFLFLSLPFVLSKGQSKNTSPLFTPVNIKKFADYLFAEKDYLRAFDEYKKYLKTENNDTVRFKIALGFQQMGRYPEALTHFKGLFFNSDFTNQSRNEFFKTLFLADSLSYLINISNNEFFKTHDSLHVPLKLSFTAMMLQKMPLPDSVSFVNIFNKKEKAGMSELYSKQRRLPYKDPTTAALLSTVVPGLGKIYTGNYGDGITAFLFTGVLGYIAYDNFRANHSFRAWLFSGLTVLFYGGNIYGSYAAAQIFNAKVNFDFVSEVKKFLEKENYFIPRYNFGSK